MIFVVLAERSIEVMGDKIVAKNAVAASEASVVPGVAWPGHADNELAGTADRVCYPVFLKPSAGGGGKGMLLVANPSLIPEALLSARWEQRLRLATNTLFLERFMLQTRHI